MTEKAMKMMDESPCMKVSAIVGGSVAAAIFAVATVYLGIYAHNNPDPDNCWVVRDLDLPALSRNEVIDNANGLNIEVTSGYPVNMSKLYSAWFYWGFYTKVALVAAMALAGGVSFYCKTSAKYIVGGATSLYALNAAVWLTTGAIWRFSKAGTVASGENLERPQGISNDDWDASVEAASAT